MAAITYIKRPNEAAIWHESNGQFQGNPFIFRALDQATWLGVSVFDGARVFDNVAPDLELHCARLMKSAKILKMNPPLSLDEVIDICHQAIAKFPKDSLLYIRPEFWATEGIVMASPDNIGFACSAFEVPWGKESFSACFSSYRRPDPRSAPTIAKATCLYPNLHLALHEARGKGFDTGISLDLNDNVVEFSINNLMYVKDGIVYTPKPNDCFLNGITRRRVTGLLSEAGYQVIEKIVSREDVLNADELFSVGNLYKVHPCSKLEDRTYPIGPVAKKAKALYWDFAHGRLKTGVKIVI